MNKIIPLVLSSFLFACGGSSPANQTTPIANQGDNDGAAKPADDCTKEPAAPPAGAVGETDAFSVTGDAVAANTARTFFVGSDVVISQSEGGSRYVKIYAVNQCGLWLAETYVGSEIGGDADVRKTTYSLVEKTGDAYIIEVLGAKVSLMGSGDDEGSFTATLVEPIETYEGE